MWFVWMQHFVLLLQRRIKPNLPNKKWHQKTSTLYYNWKRCSLSRLHLLLLWHANIFSSRLSLLSLPRRYSSETPSSATVAVKENSSRCLCHSLHLWNKMNPDAFCIWALLSVMLRRQVASLTNRGERFSVQQPYSSVLMPMKTGDAHEVLGVLTEWSGLIGRE